MRVKNQLIVPQVRISVGDRAVRVAGATLWNNMHKDMTQYRLRKCLKGRLRKHYIAKYHIWCIDWCLFLSVWYISTPACTKNCIVLFWIMLPFFSYRPGYHLHFYLVVSKMSLVLPWQPPADNNVFFCLVKEYYLYICWKIKLLLLLLSCWNFARVCFHSEMLRLLAKYRLHDVLFIASPINPRGAS